MYLTAYDVPDQADREALLDAARTELSEAGRAAEQLRSQLVRYVART